jgi:myosin I
LQGKTEATKQCLNYLATVAGSASGVQERILLANPILESWGNAKTLRNNNSSRFGKFIEILLSTNSEIVGASNTTYLLEKSRVVFQELGERSYHVFYQLLFGAPDKLIADLGLSHFRAHPEQAHYINQSGCLQIEGIDDTADFREMETALSVVGFSDSDINTLHEIIAGILHLGNLSFNENPTDSEGCVISNQPENFLIHATRLLGVDAATFNRALLFKSVRSGSKRKSVTFSPYTPKLAVENRDALAKEIYSKCFDFIVEKINVAINANPQVLASMKTNMIGILDIFGFEIFKKVV